MRVLRHREHQRRSAERTIGHTRDTQSPVCDEVLWKEEEEDFKEKGTPANPFRSKSRFFFSLFEKQVQSGKKREGKRKRLRNALAGRVREQLAAERRVRRSFYIRALSIDHWSRRHRQPTTTTRPFCLFLSPTALFFPHFSQETASDTVNPW